MNSLKEQILALIDRLNESELRLVLVFIAGLIRNR